MNQLANLDPHNTIQALVRRGGTLGILITDESGSMGYHKATVINQVNLYVDSLREQPGIYYVGVVTFSSESRVAMPIQHVHTAELSDYDPSDSTLLWVTVFRVLERLISAIRSVPEAERSKNFHCVIGVYTDGDDNMSKPENGHADFPAKLVSVAEEALALGIDLNTFGFGVNATRIATEMGFPTAPEVCHSFHEVSEESMTCASATMTARSTMFTGPLTTGLSAPSWLNGLFKTPFKLMQAMGGQKKALMVVLVDASSSIEHLNDYMQQALSGFCLNVAAMEDGLERYVGMAYFHKDAVALIPIAPIRDAQNVSSYPQGQGTRLFSTIRDLLAALLEIHYSLSMDGLETGEICMAVFSDGNDSCSSVQSQIELPRLISKAEGLGFRLFTCGIGRAGTEVAEMIGFPKELAFECKGSANGTTQGTLRLAESWRTGTAPSSLDY